MGLGIRRKARAAVRKIIACTPFARRIYGQFLSTDPASLAKLAKNSDTEKVLTDLCIDILKRVGTMPEPDGALHRYRDIPEHQHRPMNEYGCYWTDVREQIKKYAQDHDRDAERIFLDVGGAAGDCKSMADGFKYWLVDIVPRTAAADRVIEADICKPIPLEEHSVDVIFSNQVWEHLEQPWLACQELGKLLKPGGLFITCTLFAYRYHPFPEDFFRYTHKGLASLHEGFADTETLICKYDLHRRREDVRGGGHLLRSDVPPVDWFGGFRENWYVYYIGKKKTDVQTEAQETPPENKA